MRNFGVPLFGVLLLLMASCASSSDPASTTTTATNEQTESADTVDEPSTDSASEDEQTDEAPEVEEADGPTFNEAAVSPINQALGFDPDDLIEINNDYIRAAEELVRSCMADAGFDYVPVDPGLPKSFERQLELQATLSEEQFTEQYGYGIAPLWELNFQDEGVLQFVEQLLGPPPTEARSASEQEAYELALSGTTIQGLSAEDAQEQTFGDGVIPDENPNAEGSCRQIGYDTAEFPQGDIFDGFESLLGDELEALEDRFESDERVRKARTDWQTCMAEAGYSYERPDEIPAEIFESAQDLGDKFTTSPEALAFFAEAIEANLTQMDGPARFEFLERIGALQGFSMVPALQAELDELIDFELDVANRSYNCNDRDTLRQVDLELEQEFVEANADQFALIMAGES